MGTYIPRNRANQQRRITAVEHNLVRYAQQQGWSHEAACLRGYFTGKTISHGISESAQLDAIKKFAKETGVNLSLKPRL